MKELFDGVKRLDLGFWRAFRKDPAVGFGLLYLVAFLFIADALYLILTPKERREAWKS